MEFKEENLPSEKLQKEFEDNPLKILEFIQKEKESQEEHADSSEEEKKIDTNESDSTFYNKEKIKLESVMINDFSNISGFLKNEKYKKKSIINNKNDVKYVNNINNLNLNSNNNNINYENTLINYNYNSNINFDNKNNNITVNHLNIFFNFNDINNDDNNNDYVNKNFSNFNNYDCINNMELYSNKEINNKTSPKALNIKDKNCIEKNSDNNDNFNDNEINNNSNINNIDTNNNGENVEKNEYKLLFLSNTNFLLDNLKTFKGSILSQEFVDSINNEKELQILFNNIIPNISTIMCLEYGNYFFQKLLKKFKTEQKLSIYQIIEKDFYEIASNKFGTHSIQSLINNIQTSYELYALNKLISKNMYFLFIDNNAYHIIMKLILDFPEDKRNALNLFLVMNVERIITNCNGAFCINKFITHNKDLNLRNLLIKKLESNIKELIFNKYCCINLLLILETFGIDWGHFILKEIQDNFGVLCEHPVSNIFISKVLLFLNNNYAYELKVLIWSLYKNIVLMKNLISNKNHTKILNQLIELSDEKQKKYLFFILNNSKGK